MQTSYGRRGKLDLEALPATPETVSLFVASQAANGINPSTLGRRLSPIRLVRLGAGHASPHNALQVTEVMRGIRRDWGQPPAKKVAAVDDDIKKMADAMNPVTAKGLRNRALLPGAGPERLAHTVAETEKGALFRRMFVHDTIGKQRLSAQSVALVIKAHARCAGLEWQGYAGHGLRSGYLTSAAFLPPLPKNAHINPHTSA